MTQKGTKTSPTWYEIPFVVPQGTSEEDATLRELLYEKHLEILKYNELLLYPATATIYFFGTEVKLTREQFNFLRCVLINKKASNAKGKKDNDLNKILILETQKDNSKYVLPDDETEEETLAKRKISDDLANVKCGIKRAIKSAILEKSLGFSKNFVNQKKHKSRCLTRFNKQIKMKVKILVSVLVSEDMVWLTSAQKTTQNSYFGQCHFFDFDSLFNQLIEFNGETYTSQYKKSRKPCIRELKNFCKDYVKKFS